MKIITYRIHGRDAAGLLLEDGGILDIAACAEAAGVGGDFGTVRRMISMPDWIEKLKFIFKWTESHARPADSRLSEVKLLAPVPDPEKVLGAALNYYDFCRRGNLAVPTKLKVFGKYASSVDCDGSKFDLRGHKGTYEGELGVVIGRKCTDVEAAEALNYVAGYTVVCDYTANDYVREDVQLMRGKNLDGALPMGPVLVSADAIPNPNRLGLKTLVNGEVRQDSNTDQMIFDVGALIGFFSSFMTLVPGDVIATGTPAGTALQFDPPKFLRPGDRIEITISGIGTLHTSIT